MASKELCAYRAWNSQSSLQTHNALPRRPWWSGHPEGQISCRLSAPLTLGSLASSNVQTAHSGSSTCYSQQNVQALGICQAQPILAVPNSVQSPQTIIHVITQKFFSKSINTAVLRFWGHNQWNPEAWIGRIDQEMWGGKALIIYLHEWRFCTVQDPCSTNTRRNNMPLSLLAGFCLFK